MASAATDLLTLAVSRPATLGPSRLVCVDGPAGSGKTTLGLELAALTGAPLVHMDDLYAGWDGLAEGIARLADVLVPLAAGATGSYRCYDWHLGDYAETVTVPPAPWLVVEGVGSGAAAYDGFRTALAWVDAPAGVRRRRGIDRDGDAFAPHWEAWAAAEAEHFARDRTAARADVVVETGP